LLAVGYQLLAVLRRCRFGRYYTGGYANNSQFNFQLG
jgi:hypothetical protein